MTVWGWHIDKCVWFAYFSKQDSKLNNQCSNNQNQINNNIFSYLCCGIDKGMFNGLTFKSA